MTHVANGVEAPHGTDDNEAPAANTVVTKNGSAKARARSLTRLMDGSISLQIAGRWLLIAVCMLGAFWPSILRTVDDLHGGDPLGYVFVMPILAGVAAFGIARRRGRELPIHDRQIDSIVGGMGLIFALVMEWLLLPRYEEQFSLLRIDLLVCLLFVISSAVLMFGLRPVGRFWPVWLMLAVIAPLPYRMMVVTLGGQSLHVAVVLTFFAAAATGIAVGRTRRRALIGVTATVVLGLTTLAVLWAFFPQAPRLVVQFVPPGVAAFGVGIGMYLQNGFYLDDRRSAYSVVAQRSPAVRTGLVRSGLAVVACAAVLASQPLPPPPTTFVAVGPLPTQQTAPPPGWTIDSTREFDWADRFFGRYATLTREVLLARGGVPEWDAQLRPRRIVVDTLDTLRPASLHVYPPDTLYRSVHTRRSPAIPIELGHDVRGELTTVVDEDLLLTWSILSFTWTRGRTVERVNMITVDDHRPVARFPEPTPSMASDVTNTLNVLVRGNSVTIDDQPQYKDKDMLTVVGTQFVDAQWKATQS
ncbi:hypothetical protein C8K36_106204 [Rhodococcus sp. OK519]|uniref:hypothetical protein n=1 Tax=Rhodococcus sp. OK519 TaxID=2135729 RepID=UPI000D3B8F44|nr:hypothetical protein C8K36_106204 [Rhodococcus sp. OK519]